MSPVHMMTYEFIVGRLGYEFICEKEVRIIDKIKYEFIQLKNMNSNDINWYLFHNMNSYYTKQCI